MCTAARLTPATILRTDARPLTPKSESPPDATTSSGSSKKKTSTTDKRKEQNRNAQRAFRERKERVLKDLEDKIEGLNKINEDQMSENQSESG